MPINVFISYAHADAAMKDELRKHLAGLERSGQIHSWHDRQIAPGEEQRPMIDQKLEGAQLILLLISKDFLASNYCYDKELRRAIELHNARTARVVPIVLHHCDWQGTHIDGLRMLPEEGMPVTSTRWGTTDKAWTNVALHVRAMVEQMQGSAPFSSPPSRSFVDERGSGGATPQPAPGLSFVNLPQRPSQPSNPGSARPYTISRTEVGAPMNAPQPPVSTPPWTARQPHSTPASMRPRSRAPFVALTVLSLAALGGWGASQDWWQHKAPSAGVTPPAALPALTPARPTATTTPASPTTSSATICCGGVDCKPPFQDTHDSKCAVRLDHCATCPSGLKRISGACSKQLDSGQSWLLRLAGITVSGQILADDTLVCLHLSGDPISANGCTRVRDAADRHPGVSSMEMLTRLPATTADLLRDGRGVDIELHYADGTRSPLGTFRLKDSNLLQTALCIGTGGEVGKGHITLYLDDAP